MSQATHSFRQIERPDVMLNQMMLTLAIFAASTPRAAIRQSDEVEQIIAKLDMTTFPNSIGPRRQQGKRTFADYGFTRIATQPRGASLTEDDGAWEMSFRIVATTHNAIDICFHDKGLGHPGDIHAPTYDTFSALRITHLDRGLWVAHEVREGFDGCQNKPPLR